MPNREWAIEFSLVTGVPERATMHMSSIELLETTFEPQEYAFAVPINSPLRKSVGVAILATIHSDWWEQTTSRYLGPG
jgi:hypothetical protein